VIFAWTTSFVFYQTAFFLDLVDRQMAEGIFDFKEGLQHITFSLQKMVHQNLKNERAKIN
jgi:hypothetical protein